MAGNNPANWGDLKARVLSSIAMAVLGGAAIIAGGIWFQMLAVFVTAVMVWELWMMIHPDRPTPGMLLAVLTATVFFGFLAMSDLRLSVLFLVVPVIGALIATKENMLFAFFTLGLQIAGWGLVVFRTEFGVEWLLWLVLVVIISDVFGYFAGRSLGGPKFWPKVSPKKTWSGTIAGWIGAGGIGLLFMLFTDAGFIIVPLSMLLSFAGQMGDIAESAFKRRQGAKDSSTLIPGHGGLFDRFDALLGASLFLILLIMIFDIPGVTF